MSELFIYLAEQHTHTHTHAVYYVDNVRYRAVYEYLHPSNDKNHIKTNE